MEVLKEGYQIPFVNPPPLSVNPILFRSYEQSSEKGKALECELEALLEKNAVEPATGTPGFYARMFVVLKASGAWRPIIDLSTLNRYILKTKFRMRLSNQS